MRDFEVRLYSWSINVKTMTLRLSFKNSWNVKDGPGTTIFPRDLIRNDISL